MKNYHKGQEVDQEGTTMPQSRSQTRIKIITKLSALIAVLAYILFYILSRSEFKETGEYADWKSDIFMYGVFLSFSLIFYALGRLEKNKKVKYLLYYSCSTFFGLLILNYGVNDILEYYSLKFSNNVFDYLLHTNKVILTGIITTGLCWLIYLFSRQR